MTSHHSPPVPRPTSSRALIMTVIALFAIIAVTCSYVLYQQATMALQGYSVASANVGFGITGNMPSVSVIYPTRCVVVKGLVTINATVTDLDGNDTITTVTFYYMHSGMGGWDYLGLEGYDGDSSYAYLWNTSTVPDGINYQVQVTAVDITGLLGDGRSPSVFNVNNIDEEPDWTSFKYPLSTNLSQLSQWDGVSNLRLANTNGMIEFSGLSVNVDALNLSSLMTIEHAKISLDRASVPCLNVPVNLHFFNTHVNNPRILRDGVDCSTSTCTLVSNNGSTVVVRVTNFAGYEVVEQASLSIWDVTDPNGYNANQTRHKRQKTEFYANLIAGGVPINQTDVACHIRFNITHYTDWETMGYKQSTYYEFNRQFQDPGIYSWEVNCNSTLADTFLYFSNDTVNISNNAPQQTAALPNITMEENKEIIYPDLDSYFLDNEGDTVSYNTSGLVDIDITILRDNTVLVSPHQYWYGNHTFYFYAIDEYGLSTRSNKIFIQVIPAPVPEPETSGGGGGGGGGGATEIELPPLHRCVDNWQCSPWSACVYRWSAPNATTSSEYDGIQTRACADTNNCDYPWKKPNETQYCRYNPTCADLIKNHGETGVDCGGPCPPCPSCSDNIQNQGETGIDCGGPCGPCPTCFDGIKNQNETAIDCGGSCKACPRIEVPSFMLSTYLLLVVLLISVIIFTIYIFARPYVVRIALAILKLQERLGQAQPIEQGLAQLSALTLSQMEALEASIGKKPEGEILKSLGENLKHYLMTVFEIHYECTYEELIVEVRKQKIGGLLKVALTAYLSNLVELEYGKKQVSDAELRSLLQRSKELIDLVARSLSKKDKTRVPKQAAISATKELLSIYRQMVQARRALSQKDFGQARALYQSADAAYQKLSDPEKRKVYQSLRGLQDDIDKRAKEVVPDKP